MPRLAPRAFIAQSSVPRTRAPLEPMGCPRAMAPPLTLTRSGSSSSPRMQAIDCDSERLVELDEIEVLRLPAAARERLGPGRDRPLAHRVGVHARRRVRDDARERLEAVRAHDVAAGDEHAGGAVVERGAVAGRDGARPCETTVGSLASPSSVTSERGDSSFAKRTGSAPLPFCGIGTGTISRSNAPAAIAAAAFFCEPRANASCSSRPIFHLAATSSAVSPIERSGKRSAIFGFSKRQPSDVSKTFGGRARERLVGLAEDERRARHALDAAADGDLGVARRDAPDGVAHRLETRPAEAVHGDGRHLVRETREERRHARDVAVVLARLVGRAEGDLIELLAEGRGALAERDEDVRGQVVGAHRREPAAVAADGGADGVDEEDFAEGRHVAPSLAQPSTAWAGAADASGPPSGRLRGGAQLGERGAARAGLGHVGLVVHALAARTDARVGLVRDHLAARRAVSPDDLRGVERDALARRRRSRPAASCPRGHRTTPGTRARASLTIQAAACGWLRSDAATFIATPASSFPSRGRPRRATRCARPRTRACAAGRPSRRPGRRRRRAGTGSPLVPIQMAMPARAAPAVRTYGPSLSGSGPASERSGPNCSHAPAPIAAAPIAPSR